MLEDIKNGSEFLSYIEVKNKLTVPGKLRSMIIRELNGRHQRYLNLLSLVSLISRLEKHVFFDLLENLIESAKQK